MCKAFLIAWLISICGVYAWVCGHIYFWHIFGNNMWCFVCLYFGVYVRNHSICPNMCLLNKLYFECSGHIYSVIYVKYLYNSPCHMPVTSYVAIYLCKCFICSTKYFDILHLCPHWWLYCFWHTFGDNIWSKYCSCFCFAYFGNNYGVLICPFSIMMGWPIFVMCQP